MPQDRLGRKERLLALLGVLLLVVTVKVGQQVYRWYAFGPERAQIGRLDAELQDAGLGIIDSQVQSELLSEKIETIDEELRGSHARLEAYERRVTGGRVSPSVERTYRESLATHNARVDVRNDLFREWRERLEENHRFVDRYNLLADSIRTLAERIGEPYYPIPTPAAIVERRDGAAAPGFPPERER